MKLLHLLKYLLPFIAGGLTVYVFVGKRDTEYEKVLKHNDEVHAATIQQLEHRLDSLLMRDIAWSSDYLLVKDSLKNQRLKTNQVFREYLKLKNAPAVHYSDAALDSVVFALTN